MPRKQSEDVNQSARQVANQPRDDARQIEDAARGRNGEQGIVQDERAQDQPADKKRAGTNR